MYNVALIKSIKISPSKQTALCVGLLMTAVVAYLYFLNLSVVHVVMRKEATQESNQLRTEIAMLETTYIQSQHKIADRIANLEGYSIDTEKIFITRGETSLVLRDN
ncbi:MAG: hypothetical protein KBC62_03425 [Candidatus Pacebacteria bacterium]|nr:hypothetical protein [Candidatus Paceibacterota bacterium]MBP9843029.1 hypothetical protein [Candidatus Paceibacterota bacterium]